MGLEHEKDISRAGLVRAVWNLEPGGGGDLEDKMRGGSLGGGGRLLLTETETGPEARGSHTPTLARRAFWFFKASRSGAPWWLCRLNVCL